MVNPKFIVSKQKEESISIERVKRHSQCKATPTQWSLSPEKTDQSGHLPSLISLPWKHEEIRIPEIPIELNIKNWDELYVLTGMGLHYMHSSFLSYTLYSKTCVKLPLSKRLKIGFQDQLWPNAGQKYGRMLQGEQSAIRLTFIKLPFVIKIFVLSVFVWPFYTGFTVHTNSWTIALQINKNQSFIILLQPG